MELEAASQYWVAFWMGLAAIGGFGSLCLFSWLRARHGQPQPPEQRLLEIEAQTGVRL